MSRPSRSDVAQECLGDILERIIGQGWDAYTQASFLRRLAHECFHAAKVLEGDEKGSPS